MLVDSLPYLFIPECRQGSGELAVCSLCWWYSGWPKNMSEQWQDTWIHEQMENIHIYSFRV